MPKPDPQILLNAFGLPPEEAVKYFKSKGYEFSWNWEDIWQDAQAQSFTVAKVARMDILQDIREMVQEALDDGITFREVRKNLEPRLKAKGWWGKKFISSERGLEAIWEGTPWRLRTIYQTNLQTEYMAGRYKGMMAVAKNRPYWQYIAVMDARTRASHSALHGKIFRNDDPFWDSFYPPNGFNCRCRVRSISGRELKRDGLKAESSEGRLSKRDELVRKRTGEVAEVTVYRDPVTKESTAPDVGWNYNPGKARYQPDLKNYDPEIRRLWS